MQRRGTLVEHHDVRSVIADRDPLAVRADGETVGIVQPSAQQDIAGRHGDWIIVECVRRDRVAEVVGYEHLHVAVGTAGHRKRAGNLQELEPGTRSQVDRR